MRFSAIVTLATLLASGAVTALPGAIPADLVSSPAQAAARAVDPAGADMLEARQNKKTDAQRQADAQKQADNLRKQQQGKCGTGCQNSINSQNSQNSKNSKASRASKNTKNNRNNKL